MTPERRHCHPQVMWFKSLGKFSKNLWVWSKACFSTPHFWKHMFLLIPILIIFLILSSCCSANNIHVKYSALFNHSRRVSYFHHLYHICKAVSHQEDDWRTTDEGYCCRKFPFVPTAVGSCWLVRIVHKPQLLNPPLGHLLTRKKTRNIMASRRGFKLAPWVQLYFSVLDQQCIHYSVSFKDKLWQRKITGP